MKPIVNGLEQKCKGKAIFTYLDAEDARNQGTLRGFGIKSVPSFILLSPGGQEVRRWIGSVPEAQLRVVAEICRVL